MGHSYINVLAHIVFSTKLRHKIIPEDKQEELWKYMTGISKNLGMPLLAIGGMTDHIHLLLSLSGTLPISNAMQKIKGSSSKWLGKQLKDFAWQQGFGAFGSAPHSVTMSLHTFATNPSITRNEASKKNSSLC